MHMSIYIVDTAAVARAAFLEKDPDKQGDPKDKNDSDDDERSSKKRRKKFNDTDNTLINSQHSNTVEQNSTHSLVRKAAESECLLPSLIEVECLSLTIRCGSQQTTFQFV